MDNWAQAASLGLGWEIPHGSCRDRTQGWLRKGVWRDAQKGLVSMTSQEKFLTG